LARKTTDQKWLESKCDDKQRRQTCGNYTHNVNTLSGNDVRQHRTEQPLFLGSSVYPGSRLPGPSGAR
jgi:hypothetical protein